MGGNGLKKCTHNKITKNTLYHSKQVSGISILNFFTLPEGVKETNLSPMSSNRMQIKIVINVFKNHCSHKQFSHRLNRRKRFKTIGPLTGSII